MHPAGILNDLMQWTGRDVLVRNRVPDLDSPPKEHSRLHGLLERWTSLDTHSGFSWSPIWVRRLSRMSSRWRGEMRWIFNPR